METENPAIQSKRLSLVEAFAGLPDPRVAGRSKHDLVEMLVVTVCALLCGVDDFVGIETWAKERIDWLRRFLKLGSGIASHDTFGRLFGLLDRRALETGFRRWVGSVLPALAEGTVVAIDGKASRRSKMTGQQALHLVSAFASEAQLILGQEACAEKSNELTAIPVLLEALLLKGAIVTIDAMGTHSNIAQTIRDKEADYVLAVKDNQPKLAESITTFFEIGQTENWKTTPHTYTESVEKNHGRLEVRRCWAFNQLECLAAPQQWPDLKMFGVIETQPHDQWQDEPRAPFLHWQHRSRCRHPGQCGASSLGHRKSRPLVSRCRLDPTLTPPSNTSLGKPHGTKHSAILPKLVCI